MKGTSVCLLTSYNWWLAHFQPVLKLFAEKGKNSVNLGFVALNGLCDTAVLINTKVLEQTILISGNFCNATLMQRHLAILWRLCTEGG